MTSQVLSEYSLQVIATIAVAVQAIVVVVAAIYAYRQVREAQASRRSSVALHVFEGLNQDEAIHRRYELYKSIAPRIRSTRKKDDILLGRITNDFNATGFLLKHGLIDDELVITLYYAATIRCWEIMRPWIERQRVQRGDEYYAEGFEYLYEQTVVYRSRHRSRFNVG